MLTIWFASLSSSFSRALGIIADSEIKRIQYKVSLASLRAIFIRQTKSRFDGEP